MFLIIYYYRNDGLFYDYRRRFLSGDNATSDDEWWLSYILLLLLKKNWRHIRLLTLIPTELPRARLNARWISIFHDYIQKNCVVMETAYSFTNARAVHKSSFLDSGDQDKTFLCFLHTIWTCRNTISLHTNLIRFSLSRLCPCPVTWPGIGLQNNTFSLICPSHSKHKNCLVRHTCSLVKTNSKKCTSFQLLFVREHQMIISLICFDNIILFENRKFTYTILFLS